MKLSVKKIRIENKLSQDDLAVILNVSKKRVNLWENGYGFSAITKEVKEKLMKMSSGYVPFSGDKLKKKRKEMMLSQEELGKLLDMSTSMISRWEKGSATPTLKNLTKVEQFINSHGPNDTFNVRLLKKLIFNLNKKERLEIMDFLDRIKKRLPLRAVDKQELSDETDDPVLNFLKSGGKIRKVHCVWDKELQSMVEVDQL